MNPKYDPKGMLGSYRTSEDPFPNPADVKVFSGFGADDADLERGWCEPGIASRPDYDKANYHERWTVPKVPDEDFADTGILPDDVEFRQRELRSKGFLTRPRIPTERN